MSGLARRGLLELLERFFGNLDGLKVGFDPFRRDRLGQAGCAALDLPADQDVGGVDAELLSDFDNDGLFTLARSLTCVAGRSAGMPPLPQRNGRTPERRIGLRQNVVLVQPRHELRLRVRVTELDLRISSRIRVPSERRDGTARTWLAAGFMLADWRSFLVRRMLKLEMPGSGGSVLSDSLSYQSANIPMFLTLPLSLNSKVQGRSRETTR